jgi:RNA polymerase sigma-70 factor (ECF subfamily)
MTTPPVRFETLIEDYHDEIHRYLWRLLHGASQGDRALQAQDLAQEVFLRAYRAFGRLRRDSNHRAWLYKIATNCAYSALKRGQRQLRHSVAASAAAPAAPLSIPDDAGQSPDGQLARDETLAAVRAAIAALPPKQQAAVVLRHVQGLDYAEIAQALDCSQDSARANVYQGLRRLRRELGEDLF